MDRRYKYNLSVPASVIAKEAGCCRSTVFNYLKNGKGWYAPILEPIIEKYTIQKQDTHEN